MVKKITNDLYPDLNGDNPTDRALYGIQQIWESTLTLGINPEDGKTGLDSIFAIEKAIGNVTDPAGTNTVIGLLKGILNK